MLIWFIYINLAEEERSWYVRLRNQGIESSFIQTNLCQGQFLTYQGKNYYDPMINGSVFSKVNPQCLSYSSIIYYYQSSSPNYFFF